MEWYLKVVKQYADFAGRARRKEYWMFALFNTLFYILIAVVEGMLGSPLIFASLYSLVMLIPGFAVTIRRLHDTGKSGWMILLALIPLVGAIILLIFALQDSQPGTNAYGPNPKAVM